MRNETSGLKELFTERDEAYQKHTLRLYFQLRDTVVEALLQLLNLPDEEDLKFGDINLDDDMVIIGCIVRYDKTQMSPFLSKMFPLSSHEGNTELFIRKFLIGVPLDVCLQDVSLIKKYLIQMVSEIQEERAVDSNESTQSKQQTTFDTTKLTKEQLKQIVMFQHYTMGVKH